MTYFTNTIHYERSCIPWHKLMHESYLQKRTKAQIYRWYEDHFNLVFISTGNIKRSIFWKNGWSFCWIAARLLVQLSRIHSMVECLSFKSQSWSVWVLFTFGEFVFLPITTGFWDEHWERCCPPIRGDGRSENLEVHMLILGLLKEPRAPPDPPPLRIIAGRDHALNDWSRIVEFLSWVVFTFVELEVEGEQ